jgi:chemotaxis protein MotB
MKRPLEKDEDASTDRWTVSYADFMTLLFAVFVVLYASSRHETKDIRDVSSAARKGFKQLAVLPGEAVDITPSASSQERVTLARSAGLDVAALQKDLTTTLGREIARNEVVLRMTPDGFVISLRELGFFPSGEASILSGAQDAVRRIGNVLTKYGLDMRVEGHTDNVPIHTLAFQSNWELSTARASSVAMMLIDDGRFDPGRISIAGYGEYHPVESNQTVEGRQANRRVDIVIITAGKSVRRHDTK